MEILNEDKSHSIIGSKGSCVTIGNFDGLHLGHRELMTVLLKNSRRAHLPAVVVSFRPHPLKILQPQATFSRLFEQSDTEEQLAQMGVDYLMWVKFDRDFAKMSAGEFVHKYLLKSLHLKKLVIGHDFSFGSGREGNIDFLRQQAQTLGFDLHVCESYLWQDKPISSTRIRQSIHQGKVDEAWQMLGRPYYVLGKVVRGDGRGQTLGFPTANLQVSSEIIPLAGVYATQVHMDNKIYLSVTNIGLKPTFNSEKTTSTVETYIIDQKFDLYGQKLKIEFLKRLRAEQRFESKENLVAQINKDIKKAKELKI